MRDPVADEREAVLEALGVGRPQDWKKALALLRSAASEGSDSAARQMQTLRLDADEPADLALERLLAFSAAVPVSEQPRIRTIEHFASRAECQWLMGRGTLRAAQVFDPMTQTAASDPRRNNEAAELGLADLDLVTLIVRQRIAGATRLPLPVFEPPQILRYDEGQEFRPHFDYLDASANMGQRIATFLLFLNDDYSEGETEFPRIGLRHRGKAGDALFFANVDRQNRPDPLTLHAGRAPFGGLKWVLSQWIRDRTPLVER